MFGKILGLKHQEGGAGLPIQKRLFTTGCTIEQHRDVWWQLCCFWES